MGIIRNVRSNAFQCVDEVIRRDKEFFKSMGEFAENVNRFAPLYDWTTDYKWIYVANQKNPTFIPHPRRILNHQIGYLLHYAEYISCLPENCFSIPGDREKIAEGVQVEIQRYRWKLTKIVSDNPDYFNEKANK